MARMGRREFLAVGGGLAAASMIGTRRTWAMGAGDAVGLPVSATDEATGGMTRVPGLPGKKVGYAIVGLGKFAVGSILPAFVHSKNSRPTALVSGNRDKAEALAAYYGIPKDSIYDYTTFDRLADNPDVQAVYIVLPNSMHLEYTVRAAQAGKHVLCEKPLATSSADCREMIAACQNAKRKLMTAYRCRYEPFNQQMIAWGKEKKYGPLQFLTIDHMMDVGGANQWRLDPALSGGGSLVDIGIYSLNAARYLTGEEPEEVNAMIHSDPADGRFGRVEQNVAFQLRFPSGAIANCTSSYGAAYVNRYRVVGTRGWYGLDPATAYSGLRMFTSDGGEIRAPLVNQFAAEMDHFSQCIVDDAIPNTSGEEGLRDVELIERIYASVR